MSGKNARKVRQQRKSATVGELHVLASLLQWWTLPAGDCTLCGKRSDSRRTLLCVMGLIPTRDMTPGNPDDEALSDARFCRMAEEQAQGDYQLGGVHALCSSCATAHLMSIPDDLGASLAFARQMFPTSWTDAVLMHGLPGPENPITWSVRTAVGGELFPSLERFCLQLAHEQLSVLPLVAYEEEGQEGSI